MQTSTVSLFFKDKSKNLNFFKQSGLGNFKWNKHQIVSVVKLASGKIQKFCDNQIWFSIASKF